MNLFLKKNHSQKIDHFLICVIFYLSFIYLFILLIYFIYLLIYLFIYLLSAHNCYSCRADLFVGRITRHGVFVRVYLLGINLLASWTDPSMFDWLYISCSLSKNGWAERVYKIVQEYVLLVTKHWAIPNISKLWAELHNYNVYDDHTGSMTIS